MSSVALFALLLSSNPVPGRLIDDATLRVAAERAVELGERLRNDMTDAHQVFRPRAEALLVDARRDLARINRGGPTTPAAESATLFTYGKLCELATDSFGSNTVTFKPNPGRPAYIEDAAKIGFIKINRHSFAQTLQNPDDIAAAIMKTRAALKTLKDKARRDTLQTGKWQRDLAKLEKEFESAVFDLKNPNVLNKVPAEAAVYGMHGRFVGMMVISDR